MIVVAFWTCWGESPGAGAAFAFRTVGLGLHAAGFGGGGCTAAVATTGPERAVTSSMPTRALAVRRFMATRVWEWWAVVGNSRRQTTGARDILRGPRRHCTVVGERAGARS